METRNAGGDAPSEAGAGSSADSAGRQNERLHGRFGSGLERATGMVGPALEHDDSAAKIWLASSVFWFIVVTTFGLIIATELTDPETFSGISWLVFPRVRPSHVEGVIFAWLTMMYWGAIFYYTPRLLGTRKLYNERLAYWTAWAYNITLAVGFFAILTGGSQGREYAEFPWIVDVAIILVFASNIFNEIATTAVRKVRPLYVAMWWALAAPIWVAIDIFIENVMWRPGVIWPFGGGGGSILAMGNPSGYLPIGAHDAMLNWWGNHNLFGLWLTPILIAVCYYFIPRITNTPLYSHTLSLVSFWGVIFTYAAVGDHHLLQSPSPGWLKTIASVNSVGILAAEFAFFTNIFLTMRGNWHRFLTSLSLRYVITGFLFFVLVNIQGALFAQQPFNVYVHFTYFTIGHSHLALLGGFTILGMGVIYYMLPRIWNKPAYSRGLAEWQYWLVTVGFVLFFIGVTTGGFIQGQGWQIGIPEVNVLPTLKLWNIVRGIGCGLIYASAWVQAYQIIRSYVSDTPAFIRRRIQRDSESAIPSEAYAAKV